MAEKKKYNYERPYLDPKDIKEFKQLCKLYRKPQNKVFRHLLDLEKLSRVESKVKKRQEIIDEALLEIKERDPAKFNELQGRLIRCQM